MCVLSDSMDVLSDSMDVLSDSMHVLSDSIYNTQTSQSIYTRVESGWIWETNEL